MTAENSLAAPSVKWQLVTIGPELAQEWLDNYTRKLNRNLSSNTVNRFARDMRRGKWIFNGEPLQFDTDGQLMNGQHRLNAVVNSETTQQFLIVTGLPEEAHEGMDSGKPRSPGDVLTLSGWRDGNALAVMARIALSVDLSPNVARASRSFTTQEIKLRVERDPRLQEIATDILPELPNSLYQLASRSVVGYCFYRFDQINPDAALEFMHSLGTLANLPENSPILALHRRLSGMAPGRPATRQWETIAYFFMAWNAWRKGEIRNHLRLSHEDGRVRLVPLEP